MLDLSQEGEKVVNPEKFTKNRLEALSEGCLLDPSLEGPRERHILLANQIACNHHNSTVPLDCIVRVTYCSQKRLA